jgi:protein-tyrosine phosphatase
MPREFYWVLKDPAPLAGMPYPTAQTPWRNINAEGFKYIVCLTEDVPGYDPQPLKLLHTVELEDLFHGRPPQNPVREERLIRTAVEAIAGKLAAGEGVVVHCAGGTGRTGTVIGCLLRLQGFSYAEVLGYLDSLNKARAKAGWPESKWQAQLMHSYLK